MGGDHAPGIVVDGAAIALGRAPDLRFVLYGDEAKLGPLLAARPELAAATTGPPPPVFVPGDSTPSVPLRQARTTSLRLAITAGKDGEAAAAVSAGNTGAL